MITSQPIQHRRISLNGQTVALDTLTQLRDEAQHSIQFDDGREKLVELCLILDRAIADVEALR